ncbi:MAG: hypothetical protein OXP66_18870 [Candidatus Tectomicrobia bacterium]|nr:hypothetical protein [Candidatus Tectomicrobia bacterium]
MIEPVPDPEPEHEIAEGYLFPLVGFNCLDHYGEGTNCDLYQPDAFDPDNIPTYNIDALPQRTRNDDGRHLPVYHDHSQLYGIGVHDFDEHRRIFVGTDRGDGICCIPAAGARSATKLRYGTVADGVGSTELRSYLTESLGTTAKRYETAPTVRIVGSPSAKEVNWIVAAVELVNAALPSDARMRLGDASYRTITVEFRPYTEFAEDIGATTRNTLNGNEIISSRIHVDEFAFAGLSHRHFVTLIAHELMHALGLGHVSPDFDTLMEATREVYRSWQGYGVRYVADVDGNPVPIAAEGGEAAIPMPMSLLYPVDREALQVLYSKLDAGDSPTAYSYWSDSTLNIAGNGPHANFGVAQRNNISEPWAHGYLPQTELDDNTTLSGDARWQGTLVGLTPLGEAVTGEAALTVSMGTLSGAASFTELERWLPRLRPGAAGTGMTWGDGDLDYTIKVEGNTFRETGGDDGTVTGILTGHQHEGAAGTLERADLTAAFGATR